MATRSTIAKLGKDGIIKVVYCHNDGYLEYNGKMLNEYYQDESKVDELLAHGDISSLNKNIGVKIDWLDYELRTKNEQTLKLYKQVGRDVFKEMFPNGIAEAFKKAEETSQEELGEAK